MSDDQDHARRGGDDGTERALDELRLALEQLAARMGAGFREDLAPLHATLDRISSRLDDDSGRTQVLARFQALEARLDQLVKLPGDLRAHLADGLAGLDGDAVMREIGAVRSQLGDRDATLLEQLQDNLADVASGEVVGALWDEVRQLRSDLPELVPTSEPVAPSHEPDPQLAKLADELAVLRAELAEGLVVEPSDALSASLDALRSEVDHLRGSLDELASTPAPAPAPAVVDEPDRADIDTLADQVAALRDFVASELDTLRQTVTARLDAAAEATASTVAAATAQPAAQPAGEVQAAIDPDTVALLRDEIRASGAIGDEVVDALRQELKALRRRIAVKASERVLDDQQLAQIADAVAARLAQDGAKG